MYTVSMTPANNQWLQIEGKKRSRQWLIDNDKKAQKLLEKSKGDNPLCLCTKPALELYIAKRGNRYYMARMPGEGRLHASSCPNHDSQDAHCSGRGLIPKDAIINEDGTLNIKISTPVKKIHETDGPQAMGTRQNSQQVSRASITLLALLHVLWEGAGFNRWTPHMRGRRGYQQIRKYLLEFAEKTKVQGQLLKDILFIPPTFRFNKKDDHTIEHDGHLSTVVDNALERNTRLFVIGRIKEFIDGEYGIGIRLKHSTGDCIFWDNAQKSEWLQNFFRTKKSVLDVPIERYLFSIMLIDVSEQKNFNVHEIGFMFTTKNYIPVDSMYEALVCDALVEKNRRFFKPLRYDHNDEVFPDFILLDTEVQVPMEIYGMKNMPDYNVRKQVKIDYYKKTKKEYWQWDVTSQPKTYPPFP